MGYFKPSFNEDVIKGMTLERLIELHPLADVDYIKAEHERVNPETEKPKAKVKEVDEKKSKE